MSLVFIRHLSLFIYYHLLEWRISCAKPKIIGLNPLLTHVPLEFNRNVCFLWRVLNDCPRAKCQNQWHLIFKSTRARVHSKITTSCTTKTTSCTLSPQKIEAKINKMSQMFMHSSEPSLWCFKSHLAHCSHRSALLLQFNL